MNGYIRVAMAAATLCVTVPASAGSPSPTLSLALRETFDAWLVPQGIQSGQAILNKLQISATLAGERTGLPGWSAHVQIFRTDGASLSARLGDLQTADNVESEPVTRLFEAWLQKAFSSSDRTLSVRVGLLDFNADFDSTTTASLFLNSSHGIGADTARSGLAGPSIFPASSLGARVSWSPSKSWSLRAAVYDGVPGDPACPHCFASVKLRTNDGALVAGQIDYHLSDKARIEVGAWRYTVPIADAADPRTRRHDQGIYASVEGPLPGIRRLSGWLRLGIAEGQVQPVSSYSGAGVVLDGPFVGRPADKLGVAIAHAGTGAAATDPRATDSAETAFEATYQFKLSDSFAIQPDVQYIVRPSGVRGGPDALAIGLRLVVTSAYPGIAKATEATDPTVPPDGPQVPDQPENVNKLPPR